MKYIYISILFGCFNGGFYVITTITRIKSLKYINTSMYFPIYKAISPILLVFIMMLFFSETLDFGEIIWIILWVTVPLLLIWRNKKSKQIKKWYYYLIIWMLWALIASISAKMIVWYWGNIFIYMLSSLCTWALFSFITFYKNIKKNILHSNLHIKRITIITGVLNFTCFIFFMKAIEEWDNLWVIYMSNWLY